VGQVANLQRVDNPLHRLATGAQAGSLPHVAGAGSAK